jgi:hypothetical protein
MKRRRRKDRDDPSDTLHVYPVNDLREHDISGKTCWCDPDVDTGVGGTVVTHHSLDEREKFETGERKPS